MVDLSEPVMLASVHLKSNACKRNGRIQPIKGLNWNSPLNASLPIPLQGFLWEPNVTVFAERLDKPDPEKVLMNAAKGGGGEWAESVRGCDSDSNKEQDRVPQEKRCG